MNSRDASVPPHEPADSGIRPCKTADAPAIVAIYNYYVLETVITFEETPVTEVEMVQRITETTARYPWLVWEQSGAVAAYAYATLWKSRAAYRHSVEAAIYVQHEMSGQGIGTRLYAALLRDLKERGIHAVVGGISLPNAASIALHEKMGFSRIAEFREIGRKHGRWVDVGYWQLVFADDDSRSR
jgi:phosphinothricin acetyltransferase